MLRAVKSEKRVSRAGEEICNGSRAIASTVTVPSIVAALVIGCIIVAIPEFSWAQNGGAEQRNQAAGINIIRAVPYRPATRLGTPAPPHRVRTTPAPEVLSAINGSRNITQLISDAEAALIKPDTPMRALTSDLSDVTNGLHRSITSSTSRANVSGAAIVRAIGSVGVGAGGAVRNATGGIAKTVRGALGLPAR